MKNLKYLFVIAFAFAFFMVYMPVNAEQFGGSCTNEKCSIKIEKVDENDALVIDPEILTLEEGEVLYAVSISTDGTVYPENILFSITESEYNMEDVVIGYAPRNLSGSLNKKYSGYNVLTISQGLGDTFVIGDDFSIIGYLIVDEAYVDTEFSVEFVEDYFNWNSSEVVLNGIEYLNGDDSDAINTDVLFGDFTFNYVVDKDSDGNSYGYWESVNANSDKIVVDASNSMSDVYCDFEFITNSKVDMWFTKYEPMAGDEVFDEEDLNYRSFYIEAGKKETIRAVLTGGNEDVAKEILQGGRRIGFITLTITNN